jgi:hypothetical protein
VDVTFGDDAVKRRSDAQVLLQITNSVDLRLGGLDGPFVGLHQRLCRLHVLSRHHDIVLGNHAWRRRRCLQTVVRALCRRQFGLGFGALQSDRLRLGLRFDDLRLHLWRFEGREQLALLHDAAAIDVDRLHEAADLRGNRHGEIRLELAGQLDLALDGFRHDRHHLHRGLRVSRRPQRHANAEAEAKADSDRCESPSTYAAHSVHLCDRLDPMLERLCALVLAAACRPRAARPGSPASRVTARR